MLSRNITLLLFILIFLQGISSAGTVTCNGKSWTCDGTADQVEIQNAINEGDRVSLSGSFVISAPVIIDSNTILAGDGETIIKLKDHAGWKKFRGMFEALGCENITVYGFEVDGNEPNQDEECGACFYTIFLFDGSSDLVFHDLYLHDNCNDGIRVFNSESKDCNLEVYDCIFERTYHNGVYLHKANGAKIYNNKFVPRTNAGICATDSNGLDIHDNTIDTGTPPTGGAGMEIQKTTSINMDDIEIYNNIISNTNLPGIWLYGYNAYPADSAKDVYIHDNEITGCGMGRGTDHYYGGGVVVQGFNNTILENNIIKDNYNEGVTLGNVYSNPPNYNYITVMKGNTISGTIASTYKSGKDLSVSGKYSYVSDGKIPEHIDPLPTNDEEEEDEDKDGNGEGEEDVKVVPPEDERDISPEEIDNETIDDDPYNDYYAPEPAREYEFNSIFDVMQMNFYDTAGSSYYIVLPKNVDEIPTESTWTIEQHNNYALVYGPSDGLVSAHLEYAGKEGIHTLMIGERTGWRMVYNNVSVWNGDITRSGDSFYLEGAADPEEVQLTCYTPGGSFEPGINVIEVDDEENGSIFNTYLFFYLSVLLILLSVPILVVLIIISKRNFF